MSDTSQSEMTRMHELSSKQGRRIAELEQQLAELRRVLLITAYDLEQSEGRKEWADELRTALKEKGE